MIRLPKLPAPIELTSEVVETLTRDYLEGNKDNVWKQTYIEKGLIALSNGKCAYCECNITEESKYLEIEHFYPKNIFPHLVLVWQNLLPACKRCNVHKLKHNTRFRPLIHPVKDLPKEHLQLKNYRFYGKTLMGKRTIEVIQLNDKPRLLDKRYKVGTDLIQQLEELNELATDYFNGISQHTRRRNIICNKIKAILRECSPETNYSATAATVLFSQPEYTPLKAKFQQSGLWDAEMNSLEAQALEICLEQ